MPAVVVSGAGDDSVGSGDAFEFTAEFGKRGGIIDDKVAGEGNEVRFFFTEGFVEFGDHAIIGARAEVDVGGQSCQLPVNDPVKLAALLIKMSAESK